ncbi:MAG: hypothetical protein AAFN93_17015 [Bacteroidota bacterium]
MKKTLLLFGSAAVLMAGALYAGRELNELDEAVESNEVVYDNSDFDKMMDVLTSPRCINCHPSDNVPKQGDDSHPHYFGMARGEESIGYDATKCSTCHQSENNNFSGVPGAPEWSLAPDKMKWEGLSRTEIAKSMINRENNGDRSLEELEHHLTEHALVLWAWTPGVDANGVPREKPPVPLEEYKKAVKNWIEHGAIIPEE